LSAIERAAPRPEPLRRWPAGRDGARQPAVARFVVLSPGEPEYPGYADYRTVRATWGEPARVYRAGQYTIWYRPKQNLLSTVRR
jgi:hypothetical protein